MVLTRSLSTWLMLAALLMQLGAAPLSVRMMANLADQLSHASVFKICSLHETKSIVLDEDGNQIKPVSIACAKCPMCFAGGSGALLLGALTLSVFAFVTKLPDPPDFGFTSPAGADHPPSQAPPLSF